MKIRSPSAPGLAKIVLMSSLVGLGLLALGLSSQDAGAPSLAGSRILLMDSSDAANDQVAETVERLEAGGFTVTRSPAEALSLASSPEAVSFLVSRGAFNSVPDNEWSSLYDRHVIVGGIDVSLHELQPLANPGSSAGAGRLQHTPDRAIFSFMYSTETCGGGAMSGWLDNWDLAGLLQARAVQVANSPESGLPDAGCPDVLLGGRQG